MPSEDNTADDQNQEKPSPKKKSKVRQYDDPCVDASEVAKLEELLYLRIDNQKH